MEPDQIMPLNEGRPTDGWAWIVRLLAVFAIAMGAASSLVFIVDCWPWGLAWPANFISGIGFRIIYGLWDGGRVIEELSRLLRYASGFLFLLAGVACLRGRAWSRPLLLVAPVIFVVAGVMSSLVRMHLDFRWRSETQIGTSSLLWSQASNVFFTLVYVLFPLLVLAVIIRPEVKRLFERSSARRGFDVLPREVN